ncbi:MAG TPA: ribosome silencing factor [Patescibacteria group bacterium]|nr:ribosome silencing factor [Patescibacteria group bacterium]
MFFNTGRIIIVTKAKKPAAKTSKAAAKPAAKASAEKETHKLHDIVMKALDQDKGENIVSINLTGKSAIADYMVIVTGTSTRAVVGMAERLRERLGKEGVRARLEGQETGDWVIVDAGDVIVHLFRPEVREFYNLEKLWSADFSTVDYTLYQRS